MATADLVLSRFPRHLDADTPGKIIGDVVGTLATAAETQIVQVGGVDEPRRIGELDQLSDLARVVGFHGFGLAVLGGLLRRVRAADPPVRYDDWLDVARTIAADLFVLQREESGTIAGLLGATAAVLGMRVAEVDHDDEGYWHLARCVDLLYPDDPTDEADDILLALEENPPRLADLGPTPFAHSARFAVMRQGFDTVPTTVIVVGVENRTARPMVVNVDDGFGVATTMSLAAGSILRFERDGRVELDDVSIVRSCFAFSGAVFADRDADHPKDFVFADATADLDNADLDTATGRTARYAVTRPVDDAFDPEPSIPHADPLLEAVQLDRRETRFAAFVGVGTFGSVTDDDLIVQPAPQPWSGRFDASVFLPPTPPSGLPAFEIGFEWDEREAYAVKVWLPFDLQELDAADEIPIREVVRRQLDRYRAAGVHVYTAHADPRWTLGTGVLRDLDTESALGVVVAGTEMWEDDIEQPGDGPT